MARTTFSGPVASDNGFEGNLTGNVTGNISGALLNVTIPSATVAATGTVQANVLNCPPQPLAWLSCSRTTLTQD